MVAPAAVGRAVLLGRAAATMTAASAGLRLVSDPRRQAVVLVIVLLTTVAGLITLSRFPDVVRRPFLVIALDSLVVLAVLAISRGGVAYFCCAVGASALAGVLLGMRALALWALHAALGYYVAAAVLRATTPVPDIAAFVLAFPMANVLAGIGATVATAALVRYVNLSVEVVATAQRSAAASERARLARELHDSVTKTLRGVSFAALALPSSMRRHPALAEQLACTVSQGATAAAREARELLDGLRLDSPDEDFVSTLRGICEHWTQTSGIPVRLTTATVEPPVAVRYELARILREALRNVTRHARARYITVDLSQRRRYVRLRIHDDGQGFEVPEDLSVLRANHHYGIIGMHERARTVGGCLRIVSSPGNGTTIDVRVPGSEPDRATA
jgi:signal transduction histidine kinase